MPVRTTKVHVMMRPRDLVTFVVAFMDIGEILTSFMVAKLLYNIIIYTIFYSKTENKSNFIDPNVILFIYTAISIVLMK